MGVNLYLNWLPLFLSSNQGLHPLKLALARRLVDQADEEALMHEANWRIDSTSASWGSVINELIYVKLLEECLARERDTCGHTLG